MITNLVGGRWLEAHADQSLPVFDPATGSEIDRVPLSGAADVDLAVSAAAEAFKAWSHTSVMERVRLMFAYKALLETHFEELSEMVTRVHGKTLNESRGEVRRGIEVVDFACGAPTLLQGRTLRNVSTDVDQDLYRFPVGVCAGIPPFNFPVMIPLWMMPIAVVAGNTFVLKPSERTPLPAVRLAQLFLEAGFPEGVLNLVHGGKESVDALLRHPGVNAISFVGSEPVARYVYTTAAAYGKRVQALGGAKNHLVIMPDVDFETAAPAILNSAFGNAGERCLAGSVAVMVGGAGDSVVGPLVERAAALRLGPGDQPNVDVGPLIRSEHRDRVAQYVARGESEGAKVLLDGRTRVSGPGYFFGPTILDGVSDPMAIGREEIFGPVLSVSHVSTLEEAISQSNRSALGNMAVIFTTSGVAAREFREHVEAGMVGINVPVAQPFAFFPFSGWKGSFYGDLHAHGTDGFEFYTRKKVVVTRW